MEFPTRKVSVRYTPSEKGFGSYFVHVMELKYNTLRGDRYYVTRKARSFRNKKHALAFAARFS